MEVCILVFPNQLFDIEHWRRLIRRVDAEQAHMIVLDDPVFYGDRKGNKQGIPQRLRLNQLRVCYQLVSVQRFVERIRKSGLFTTVMHVSFDDIRKNGYEALVAEGRGGFHAFDPEDHLLRQRLQSHKIDVVYHPSPSFVMTPEDLAGFVKGRGQKRLQHAVFFDKVKRKINFLENVKSKDAMNRQPFPKALRSELPSDPYVRRASAGTVPLFTNAQLEELWDWVEKHPFFKSHTKPLDKMRAMEHLKQLPLTPEAARAWFDKFLKERFRYFGKYEDAIVADSPYLYHSGISIFLNNGLLVPAEILEALKREHAKGASMQNLEAFARQLFGWREYARLYYEAVPKEIYLKNVFGMEGKSGRKLGKEWYEARTGVPVVDQAIRDAFDMGYLHHIRRLMVMSNFMMLNEIHPDGVYQWMYEFSLDAWDWVMVFNCYSMATWSDGGHGMRKPYISSSAYVKKMSDEPRGEWESRWNQLYTEFLEKHSEVLRHTPYASVLAQRKKAKI